MINSFYKQYVILTMLIFSAAVSSFASEPAVEVDDLIGKVEKSFRETRSMTATFTQLVESKGLGQVIEKLHGKMWMKKPLRMRWEYEKPEGRLMVVDAKRLWFYDPQENVTRYDDIAGFLSPSSPALFLAGEATLSELFTIDLVKPAKKDKLDVIKLRLTPKEPQPGVKAMLLILDNSSLDIMEIRMVDHLGNKNRIMFGDVNRNAKQDMNLFKFTPPEGSPVRSIGGKLGK